jgi:mediator of RNA polymerase II transcription subunit 12
MESVYRKIFRDLSGPLSLKLDVLLTWSVTPDRVADSRRYAVASLFKGLVADADAGCQDLQDPLVEWLDANQDFESAERSRLALLFSELMRVNLFSYSRYLQRLIASGETSVVDSEVSLFFGTDLKIGGLT